MMPRPEITDIHTHCACLAGISELECVCVLTATWVSLLGEEKWPGPLFLAGQQGCDAALTWVELNGQMSRRCGNYSGWFLGPHEASLPLEG